MSGVPTSQANLQRRVELLERQLDIVRGTSEALRIQQADAPRDIRLAITVDDGSYPTPGGQGYVSVPIKFIDGSFPATAGWNSIAFSNRNSQPFVNATHTAEGAWVPPDTVVGVMWQRAPKSVAADQPGEWWILPHIGAVTQSGTGSPVRVQAKAFLAPGFTGATMDRFLWNGTAWVDSTEDLTVRNSNSDCCLLSGEYAWAFKLDDDNYEIQVSKGLYRRVKTTAAAAPGTAVNCNIIDHSDGTCSGQEVGAATINCCNGDANTTGHRQLFDDEEIFAAYLHSKWHVVSVPRVTVLAKPTTNLQSGSTGTFNLWRATPSLAVVSGVTFSARNELTEDLDTADLYRVHWDEGCTVGLVMPAFAEPC